MYIGRVYAKPHKSTQTSCIVQYVSYLDNLNNRKPGSQTLEKHSLLHFFPVARTQAFTDKVVKFDLIKKSLVDSKLL